MSQTKKLYELLSDRKPHRTDEIMKVCYGDDHLGLARVGARIWDIKNKHNVEIESWKDKDVPSLWWYQIKQKDTLFDVQDNKVISNQDLLKYR